MKFLLKRLFAGVCCLSLITATTGCATYNVHPEFKERHKNIKTFSVMPPEIDAYMLTFKGDKKMLKDLIPMMTDTTVETLEEVLSNKGYAIKKLDISEDVLKGSPDLRTSLFHVNELFKKELENIRKMQKNKFIYTLGSDVNVFANRADCDVLIFVKEEGIKKSVGEVAKDMTKGILLSASALLVGVGYLPIPQTATTVVHIAVVDSNDGAILWYRNNLYEPNYNPEKEKHVKQLVKSLINQFPNSAFKKKGIKPKPNETAQPEGVAPQPAPIEPSVTVH